MERAIDRARAARRRLPPLRSSAQAKTSRSILVEAAAGDADGIVWHGSPARARGGPAGRVLGDGVGQAESRGRRQLQGLGVDATVRPLAAEDGGAADRVPELAYVARPARRRQRGQRRGLEPARPDLVRQLAQEVGGQKRDVASPLTQRGQVDAEPRQTVVEILTEGPPPRFAFQIAQRHGDDPHPDVDLAPPPHAAEPSGLQHPQQLRLQIEGQLADLVEDQRAPRGFLEPTRAARPGAGEGAPLVAKQLAFCQLPRQRAAVHRDERTLRVGAELVQRAGEQLLAGSALSAEEHRHAGGGDQPGARDCRPQRRVFTDDGRERRRRLVSSAHAPSCRRARAGGCDALEDMGNRLGAPTPGAPSSASSGVFPYQLFTGKVK